MGFELEPNEFVVRRVRKHWLLFFAELLPYAILAVLPFALVNLLGSVAILAPLSHLIDLRSAVGHVGIGVWLLMVWTVAWGTYTRAFLNLWVLTSQRIVNVKQKRFFYREVSSLFLSRVQDVTSDVNGVVESILNVGDIKVQSAGEEVEFVMANIPHPDALRDLILKYVPEEDKTEPGV